MKEKVFVGLSGGVDSATSAALLQEQGYDVTGVFIKIWQPEFIECTWKEDRLDAMRVCAALDIPFREIDLSEEYKREVVEEMVAQYARGITPNPDVLCNRSIKFGHFATWALSQGAAYVATGHYAQIQHRDGRFELLRAHDAAKDQSYFLYRLGQDDLAHALFPIGGMLKSEVRAHAERLQLPVAKKADSQGLCFVGDVSMRDFLARYITVKPGPVENMEGKPIGEHEGAALYTLGQRHGFRFTNGASNPQYVIAIDVEHNTVRVSPRRADAERTSVVLHDESWVRAAPESRRDYEAQARYHEQPVGTFVDNSNDIWTAQFKEPHIASPGQSLVLYEGEVCLGGGVIS